jgi:glucokinase
VRVLAGDIGGTKSNLGLFEMADGHLRHVRSAKYRSAEFPGLTAVIEAFLAEGKVEIDAACFGIPGPVIGNRASTTNLPWLVDGAQLAAGVGIPVVALINDLVATAEGLPLLEEDEVAVLQAGAPQGDGNRALIAAGTGLGMALIPRVGERWVPVPSEGGHMDFAPRTEEEIGLLRHLRERFGRVSAERVVSGMGLYNIYQYLRDVVRMPESPPVREAMREAIGRGEDPARIIGESAMMVGEDRCGLCARALEMFVASYGATAGNLALLSTATGGVWLGGGIAPKILPRLSDGLFLQTFTAKGRFVPFLEKVPVRVVLNDRAALLGAARHAASLLHL